MMMVSERTLSEDTNRYKEYDNYAWFWNKYWGRTSARRVLPIVKELVLGKQPQGIRVLDVCCGSGQLAKILSKDGYQLSGIDGSSDMIQLASQNCTDGNFVVGDIRVPFPFQEKFHVACSFYDSLNHILCLEDLASAFEGVYGVLENNGVFIFDLNMEDGFKSRWNNRLNQIVQQDYVCIEHFRYNGDRRIGTNNVTLFLLQDEWVRKDVCIVEKCYTQSEIIEELSRVGFTNINMFESSETFNLVDDQGRYYFVCEKK